MEDVVSFFQSETREEAGNEEMGAKFAESIVVSSIQRVAQLSCDFAIPLAAVAIIWLEMLAVCSSIFH